MPNVRRVDGRTEAWRELDLDRSQFMSWRRQRRLENLLLASGLVEEAYAKADLLTLRLKESIHWTVDAMKKQVDRLIEQSIKNAAAHN